MYVRSVKFRNKLINRNSDNETCSSIYLTSEDVWDNDLLEVDSQGKRNTDLLLAVHHLDTCQG